MPFLFLSVLGRQLPSPSVFRLSLLLHTGFHLHLLLHHHGGINCSPGSLFALTSLRFLLLSSPSPWPHLLFSLASALRSPLFPLPFPLFPLPLSALSSLLSLNTLLPPHPSSPTPPSLYKCLSIQHYVLYLLLDINHCFFFPVCNWVAQCLSCWSLPLRLGVRALLECTYMSNYVTVAQRHCARIFPVFVHCVCYC